MNHMQWASVLTNHMPPGHRTPAARPRLGRWCPSWTCAAPRSGPAPPQRGAQRQWRRRGAGGSPAALGRGAAGCGGRPPAYCLRGVAGPLRLRACVAKRACERHRRMRAATRRPTLTSHPTWHCIQRHPARHVHTNPTTGRSTGGKEKSSPTCTFFRHDFVYRCSFACSTVKQLCANIVCQVTGTFG